jgi:hypothetical protein
LDFPPRIGKILSVTASAAQTRRFRKDGPKRRRRTRRELPYGQVRRWGSTVGNFKRECEARTLTLFFTTDPETP